MTLEKWISKACPSSVPLQRPASLIYRTWIQRDSFEISLIFHPVPGGFKLPVVIRFLKQCFSNIVLVFTVVVVTQVSSRSHDNWGRGPGQ